MVLGAEFLVLDSLGLMTVSLFPLGHNESNLLCLCRERVPPPCWNGTDVIPHSRSPWSLHYTGRSAA